MLELSSTTRECEILAANFHPILVPLNLCQFGMGNIVVPYLFPAFGPSNWAPISFRKRNKTSRRLRRAMPLSMLVVLSTAEMMDCIPIIKARNIVCPSRGIAEFPTKLVLLL
uniref:Uncharacterized protein n=1 Tax=Opuntia streptacantha TaxID=393608 RepID=A0A7C8YLC7_OPUST